MDLTTAAEPPPAMSRPTIDVGGGNIKVENGLPRQAVLPVSMDLTTATEPPPAMSRPTIDVGGGGASAMLPNAVFPEDEQALHLQDDEFPILLGAARGLVAQRECFGSGTANMYSDNLKGVTIEVRLVIIA